MARPVSCRICPEHPCVKAYHDASDSVRRWLKSQILAKIQPVAEGKKTATPSKIGKAEGRLRPNPEIPAEDPLLSVCNL